MTLASRWPSQTGTKRVPNKTASLRRRDLRSGAECARAAAAGLVLHGHKLEGRQLHHRTNRVDPERADWTLHNTSKGNGNASTVWFCETPSGNEQMWRPDPALRYTGATHGTTTGPGDISPPSLGCPPPARSALATSGPTAPARSPATGSSRRCPRRTGSPWCG